jgi:hypothetical protein
MSRNVIFNESVMFSDNQSSVDSEASNDEQHRVIL